MHKIRNVMNMEKVELFTLTSLVEYLQSGIDVPNEFVGHIFINVTAPDHYGYAKGYRACQAEGRKSEGGM